MMGLNILAWIKVIFIGIALVILGYVGFNLKGWLLSLFSFTKENVIPKIDPTSNQNLAYTGVNTVLSSATGEETSLGIWLYNKIHGDEFQDIQDKERMSNNRPKLDTAYDDNPTNAIPWGVP